LEGLHIEFAAIKFNFDRSCQDFFGLKTGNVAGAGSRAKAAGEAAPIRKAGFAIRKT
jgi:hypothetical protein